MTTQGPNRAQPPIDPLGHELLEMRVLRALVGEGEREVRVGRFVLERELGSGGMGTIYEAWDDQLKRRVALKFLRELGSSDVGEQRMLREAQALAQLSHPNVVPIYDVGRHEGRVWLAMEYIPGTTLSAWAAEQPRSRTELLGVWLAAGRGLAAVHVAGLIHRDVKPDNIMIGDDGRVRVVDFGLVRAADESNESSASGGPATLAEGGSESLTAPDSFLGTPAYAAPEQLARQGADARSDQYSYCVGLWQALCGERPPSERGHQGLVPLPAQVSLPSRLHVALSKGLALEPRERFASMDELLAALAPRSRRWLAPLLAAGLTAGFALALGYALEDAASSNQDCSHAGDPIAKIWSEARREQLSMSMPPAAAVLDEWVTDWTEAATESCADVHVRARRSPASLERRSLCLDRRLADFTVVVAQAETGELGAFEHLSDPSTCLDEGLLVDEASAVAPEGSRAQVETIRAELADLRLSSVAVEERLARARASHREAKLLGWTPLLVEAALALAKLEILAQHPKLARVAIGEAIDLAETTGDNELLANAWSLKAKLARDLEFDSSKIAWALDRREAVLGRFEASARQRGRLAVERALWHQMQGRTQPAEQAYEAGDAYFEEAGVGAAIERGAGLRDYGHLLAAQGRADEAERAFARAREVEAALGHVPASSLDRFNEGLIAMLAGESERAEWSMLEALSLARREHGTVSAQVAHIHVGLAAVHDMRGEVEEAASHARLADEIGSLTLAPDDGRRADVHAALGTIALRQRRADDALEAFEAALAIEQQASSPDPSTLTMARSNVAEARLMLGQPERARELVDRALAGIEGPEGPAHVYPLKAAGAARLALGQPEEALPFLLRALELHRTNPGNEVEAAEVLWLLAQAEAALGRDATKRRREARAAYAALGPWWTWRIREIDDWTPNDKQGREP